MRESNPLQIELVIPEELEPCGCCFLSSAFMQIFLPVQEVISSTNGSNLELL